MSRDRFDVLERFAPLFETPEPSFEAFVRRRDRKRRNQRIAAGVVGIGVFVAAVGLVVVGGSFDRTQTPATSGPAVTGPTFPAPTNRVGFVGLPPEGATPSTPERGYVVLRASGRGLVCGARIGSFCYVWVYADGRLIWIADQDLPYGANERTTGLLEQRLTPAGVELLVSEFTSTGACSSPDFSGPFDCSGAAPLLSFPAISKHVGGVPVGTDPTWGLPASAWGDLEIRPFVPARFGACTLQEKVPGTSFGTVKVVEPSRVLAWIPSSAADLLRGKDVELPGAGGAGLDHPMTCFALTSDEARAVTERLDDAGVEQLEWYQSYGIAYPLVRPNRFPEEPVLWIGPLLPHGEWILTGGG